MQTNDDATATFERFRNHLKENQISDPFVMGQKLTIDPATQRFVGNDEANKLISRDYRASFVVPSPEQV